MLTTLTPPRYGWIFFLPLVFLFSSCKKHTNIDTEDLHQKKKQYKLILNWIESQNSNGNHEKDRRISNIQESLIENSYTITKTRDNRFIAAIEINTSSDGSSQGIKDAKKYLVIRLNDKDSIQWAMLLEFSNKQNTIPDATTFANFFESEEVQDGKYRVTTIWGSFLFESEYLNNTVIIHKALEKRKIMNNQPLRYNNNAPIGIM